MDKKMDKNWLEEAKEETIQRMKEGTMKETTEESKILEIVAKIQQLMVVELLVEKKVFTRKELTAKVDAHLKTVMGAFKELVTDNKGVFEEEHRKQKSKEREEKSYFG